MGLFRKNPNVMRKAPVIRSVKRMEVKKTKKSPLGAGKFQETIVLCGYAFSMVTDSMITSSNGASRRSVLTPAISSRTSKPS